MKSHAERLLTQLEKHRANGHRQFAVYMRWTVNGLPRSKFEHLAFNDYKELRHVFQMNGIHESQVVAMSIIPVKET